MALYLGKKKITPIKVVDLPDDLDKELTALEEKTDILGEKITELKDVSNETLNIRENGDYDVKDYGKVNVKVGDGLRVPVPDELSSTTSIYTFMPDNNTVLLSSGDSIVKGIWVYKIDKKECIKLYTEYYGWQYFQMIGNKCLITSSVNAGVLIYNLENNTINRIFTTGSDWKYFHLINNKCLICSSSSSSTGILVYNYENDSIVKSYSSGYEWWHFHTVGSKCLISSWNKSYTGILVYNYENDTIEKKYDIGYSWRFSQVIGNKCLISSQLTSDSGIVLYDSFNDSFTKLYDGYNWQYYFKIGNKCLISALSGGTGIVLYNDIDGSIQQISTIGNSFKYGFVLEDKVIFATSSGGTDSRGVWLYKYEDDSITKIYTSGYDWGLFYPIKDVLLIGAIGSGGSGFLKYNPITDEIKSIFSGKYGYDIVIQDGDNYYFEGSDKSRNKAILLYNSIEETMKLVEYYVEVQ